MAEYYRIFPSSEAVKVTRLSARQIIHLCETGTIEAAIDADGTGSRRAYNSYNMLELLLIKSLLDTGIRLNKIKKLIKDLKKDPEDDFFLTWGSEWDDGLLAYFIMADGSEQKLALPENVETSLKIISAFVKKKNLNVISSYMVFLGPLKDRFNRLADGKLIVIK